MSELEVLEEIYDKTKNISEQIDGGKPEKKEGHK